jgi:hypothetical protein
MATDAPKMAAEIGDTDSIPPGYYTYYKFDPELDRC